MKTAVSYSLWNLADMKTLRQWRCLYVKHAGLWLSSPFESNGKTVPEYNFACICSLRDGGLAADF